MIKTDTGVDITDVCEAIANQPIIGGDNFRFQEWVRSLFVACGALD